MKDFNFFEPYIQNEKLSRNKRMEITITAILIIFAMAALYVVNDRKIKSEQEGIAILENMLNSESSKKIIEEMSSEENMFSILQQYYNGVHVIEMEIENRDIVNSELIDKVLSTIPKKVFFSSMSITRTGIQIQASSDSRISAAEIEHNLKELGIFEKVYIPALSVGGEEGSEFNFSITCTLRGVSGNED